MLKFVRGIIYKNNCSVDFFYRKSDKKIECILTLYGEVGNLDKKNIIRDIHNKYRDTIFVSSDKDFLPDHTYDISEYEEFCDYRTNLDEYDKLYIASFYNGYRDPNITYDKPFYYEDDTTSEPMKIVVSPRYDGLLINVVDKGILDAYAVSCIGSFFATIHPEEEPQVDSKEFTDYYHWSFIETYIDDEVFDPNNTKIYTIE